MNSPYERMLPGRHTANCRAMAAEIFGDRMPGDRSAILQGTDQRGRGKCCIDNYRHIIALPKRAERRQITDAHGWIGDGLNEERLCSLPQRIAHLVEIASIHQPSLDAETR